MIRSLTPIQQVNDRLKTGREYLREVGWTRCTHNGHGEPTDVRGALYHCDRRDGVELVAARMLDVAGFDIFWNDIVCQNVFEACQAMDREYTYADLEGVYGKRFYSVIGLFKLLTMTTPWQRENLSAHLGPADLPVLESAVDIAGRHNPAFVDVRLIAGMTTDPRERMMCDALVATVLLDSDLPAELAHMVAPMVETMGLA